MLWFPHLPPTCCEQDPNFLWKVEEWSHWATWWELCASVLMLYVFPGTLVTKTRAWSKFLCGWNCICSSSWFSTWGFCALCVMSWVSIAMDYNLINWDLKWNVCNKEKVFPPATHSCPCKYPSKQETWIVNTHIYTHTYNHTHTYKTPTYTSTIYP